MTRPEAVGPTVVTSVTLIIIQLVASIYFASDAVQDLSTSKADSISVETWAECVLSALLLMAVLLVAHQLREVLAHIERQKTQLTVATGAMAELLSNRFDKWGLSRAECDVALFALKGCPVGQIARLRNSAEGTVRSQLSQIYTKAGVTSQTMLMALFFEDLL